jgi:hypothetical protein
MTDITVSKDDLDIAMAVLDAFVAKYGMSDHINRDADGKDTYDTRVDNSYLVRFDRLRAAAAEPDEPLDHIN